MAIPHLEDTIVALSSAPGAGWRAIVRISGPAAAAIVASMFQPTTALPEDIGSRLTPRRVITGNVALSGVSSPLPVDLLFFRGPHSYTGQDLAEFHTIGSPPLVERLIADLLTAGCRAAEPGEFTLRAFLAGKKDLPQAEAVLAVIEASTDADLQTALGQLAGGVSQPLAQLRDDLLNLLADVEAALDFVDEDIEFVSRTDILTRLAAGIARLTNLKRQLDERTVSGRPFRVAIVGEPNAGKSSLFNALVGTSAAIVAPVAGTTRDYLVRALSWGGVPVELIDTAGWDDEPGTIAAQAQRLGQEQSHRADLLLWCVPADSEIDAETLAELCQATPSEVMIVRTKSDLESDNGRHPSLPFSQSHSRLVGVFPASVVAAQGLDVLNRELVLRAQSFHRPPLAPSQSRCRHHVELAITRLREAHAHALFEDPPELLALAVRLALEQIGEMAGAVYTNDLLDRVFSRFCIGK